MPRQRDTPAQGEGAEGGRGARPCTAGVQKQERLGEPEGHRLRRVRQNSADQRLVRVAEYQHVSMARGGVCDGTAKTVLHPQVVPVAEEDEAPRA